MPADKSLRGKILVVDNDPSIVTLMSAVLQSGGYGVICAGDAASGLSVARAERPILIFLDGSAAQRSGATLYSTLRRDPDLHRVPVVMLLDSPSQPRRSGGPQKRLPPPDACVTRPLAPYLLLATVSHVLQARLSIN